MVERIKSGSLCNGPTRKVIAPAAVAAAVSAMPFTSGCKSSGVPGSAKSLPTVTITTRGFGCTQI